MSPREVGVSIAADEVEADSGRNRRDRVKALSGTDSLRMDDSGGEESGDIESIWGAKR